MHYLSSFVAGLVRRADWKKWDAVVDGALGLDEILSEHFLRDLHLKLWHRTGADCSGAWYLP